MSQSVANIQAVPGTGNQTAAPAPMAISLSGYAEVDAGDIADGDNLLTAFAKLEARVAALEA
jgi:hypothetical protein